MDERLEQTLVDAGWENYGGGDNHTAWQDRNGGRAGAVIYVFSLPGGEDDHWAELTADQEGFTAGGFTPESLAAHLAR